MRVLVACEESQEVTKAFRERGHEAYSCDLQDCSGGFPEWHIKDDVRKHLWSGKWDHVVAHPVCTRLANSGVRWLASREEKDGYEWDDQYKVYLNTDLSIWEALYEAAKFFNYFVLYGKLGHSIRIENPIHHKYATALINAPYSQIIQPWQFGHKQMKATCLWNFGVNNLIPTDVVGPPPKDKAEKVKWQNVWTESPGPNRSKNRSKTFPGVAKAIAEQCIVSYPHNKVKAG